MFRMLGFWTSFVGVRALAGVPCCAFRPACNYSALQPHPSGMCSGVLHNMSLLPGLRTPHAVELKLLKQSCMLQHLNRICSVNSGTSEVWQDEKVPETEFWEARACRFPIQQQCV